jgi:hypothetical protein
MAITLYCPQGHAVVIDEAQREHVCPRCGIVFTHPDLTTPFLPGAMAARPEPRRSRDEDEDEDDRPRKRRRRDDDDDGADDDRPRKREDGGRLQGGPPRKRRPAREEPEEEEDDDVDDVGVQQLTRKQKQLAMVRLGLIFHIVKFSLMLAGMGLGFLMLPLIVVFALIGGADWLSAILFHITFGFAITLAPLVGTIGSVMCAMAPPKSESRGLIIVSIIFDVLAPFFGLLQLIMWWVYHGTGDERVERLGVYMWYARVACTVVAWWLVQMYLRKLMFYLRESLLASESLNVIVHLLMAMVITPALFIGTMQIALIFPGLVTMIAFFATLGWMIYFGVTFPLRQFRLLINVRKRIWERFLKPEDDD